MAPPVHIFNVTITQASTHSIVSSLFRPTSRPRHLFHRNRSSSSSGARTVLASPRRAQGGLVALTPASSSSPRANAAPWRLCAGAVAALLMANFWMEKLNAPTFDLAKRPADTLPMDVIITHDQARCLLADVRRVLYRLGISLGKVNVEVSVEPIQREGQTIRAVFPPPVRHRVDQIVITSGMPALHAAQVLAHEFMHAWLWMHEFPPLSRRIEEGLCELAAFMYLYSLRHEPAESCLQLSEEEKHLIDYELAAIELNQSEAYGDGFRECAACLRTMSLHQLLGYVRNNARLPVVESPMARPAPLDVAGMQSLEATEELDTKSELGSNSRIEWNGTR